MLIKIRLFNLILAVIVIVVCQLTVSVWFNDGVDSKPKGENRISASTELNTVEYVHIDKLPDESVYDEIIDKNLFTPDRREYKTEVVAGIPKKNNEVKVIQKLNRKDLLVYGIVGQNGIKKALIRNIKNNQDDPDLIWVTTGQIIGDMVVTDIQHETINVSKNGELYSVQLFENKVISDVGLISKSSEPTVISGEIGAGDRKGITDTNLKNRNNKENVKPNDIEKESGEPQYRYEETPFGTVKTRIR